MYILLSLLIEFDYEAMGSSSAEEDDAGLLKFRCICVFERLTIITMSILAFLFHVLVSSESEQLRRQKTKIHRERL